MKLLLFAITTFCAFNFFQDQKQDTTTKQTIVTNKATKAKIQVAILLDVSNSMDGLIDQAKAQLWNMVNTVGKAKCEGVTPNIEIALYEYGRSNNDQQLGYIKQISPFTKDLDQLSESLFALKTNGGDEYCSHVIYSSLQQLKWDTAPNTYKVIFIAGNEDFNQGSVKWTTACAEAKKQGVIVNTIYCGDRMQGIKEHWNIVAECGSGSYTNINQDAKAQEIPTPYDSMLFVLNDKLNTTYLAYGALGEVKAQKQISMDVANKAMSESVMASRISVKGKASLYKNEEWDLVDASKTDSSFLEKIDLKSLAPGLQVKSRDHLKKMVKEKAGERTALQLQIAKLTTQRETYIAAERKKIAGKTDATLETEIEKIIKEQAKRFKMIIP